MEIRYFVRTTGERKLDDSLNQINYELLIDTEHKPIESFIAQLKYISEYNAVLLEDDVILCKDFKKRIEEVINNHPKDIINFFTRPLLYFTSQYSFDFYYNQCTFYPKGIGERIGNEMIDLISTGKVKLPNEYDSIECEALKQLNIPHLTYRPCLVQHNDRKSLISSSNPNRTTPYFLDYLDQLNILYDSKECILRRKELVEYRNNHLKLR